jgi:hypothetical protein
MSPERIAKHRRKPLLPSANRFVGEDEAAIEEHLGKVSKAELVPEPPQDHKEDDIGGELQEVEGSSCAFVEPATAFPASEASIAKGGPTLELGRHSRAASGAVHRVPPSLPPTPLAAQAIPQF